MIRMRVTMGTAIALAVLMISATTLAASSAETATRAAGQPGISVPNSGRTGSTGPDEDTVAEKKLEDAFVQSKPHDAAQMLLIEKAIHDCYVTDADVCNRALTLQDRKWKEEFDERSYRWHLFSTKLIFFLVILIVMFGLYITYVQFNRDYHDWSPPQHHPTDKVKIGATAAADAAESVVPLRPVSTFKMGPGGLELSSQVIGLIVLALSFGFFYLYVKEVYPMVENKSTLAFPITSSPNK
jgi:hypothetical protein